MKKLMLVALSVAMSTMLYAHGGNTTFNSNDRYADARQEMDEIHEVMHNTSIKGENTENGIVFEITSDSEAALTKINMSFVDEREKLDAFFKDVSIQIESLDNGVKLRLESDDDRLVSRLQAYGSRSVYQYLHSSFVMEGFGRSYHGYGPGMMFGHGGGRGFMNSPCHRSGFQSENGTSIRPGYMH
jgi:hypothetical protein